MYGDKICRNIFIAAGAGLVLYAAYKIFLLVYIPDLPPPQDRPSAIKGPIAKLSNLTQMTLNLGGSQAGDLEPLLRLMRLQTLSINGATKAQRMSLRNIPAGLVELKF